MKKLLPKLQKGGAPWNNKPKEYDSKLTNPLLFDKRNTEDLGNIARKTQFIAAKKNHQLDDKGNKLPASGQVDVTPAPHEYVMGGGVATDIIGDLAGRIIMKNAGKFIKPLLRIEHNYTKYTPTSTEELGTLNKQYDKVYKSLLNYYEHPEVKQGFKDIEKEFGMTINLFPKLKGTQLIDDDNVVGAYLPDAKRILLNKNSVLDWDVILPHEYRHAIDMHSYNKDLSPRAFNKYYKEMLQYSKDDKNPIFNMERAERLVQKDPSLTVDAIYKTSPQEIIAEIPVVKTHLINTGRSPAEKFNRESFTKLLNESDNLKYFREKFNFMNDTQQTNFANNFHRYFGLAAPIIGTSLINKNNAK